MKFSEKWLREWIDPPGDTAALAEKLTMAGLEVDQTEPVAGEFSDVVVGEVLTVEPHPDADRLRVCQVNAGADAPLSIVCGAPNVHAGMRAPVAIVGAVLPGGLKIKRSKLRGVESHGMLCSAKELGLAEDAAGLLSLPANAPVGADLREYLHLDDVSIELGLTPNRSDCLGVAGVARETGVLFRQAVETPPMPDVEPSSETRFPVTVEAAADCPHYVGRVITGVNPKAVTPLWMQERLRRSGLRSLAPVVDVTNYVLLELGQPMHAFDLDRLHEGIVVRRAAAGETLMLLNDEQVELDESVLVIADGRGPVALAGVMGGSDSAVDATTTSLFLESAFFNPQVIAGRARRFGMHTDSSHRFERGVDPQLQRRAIERATALLLDIVGGAAGPVLEVSAEAHLPQRSAIALRADRVERVLGLSIPAADISESLQRLGMDLVEVADGWQVTPPSFRFDMAEEVDLIEEVGRIHGYSEIPSRAPRGALAMQARTETDIALPRLRALLVDRGYQEALTYSFVDPKTQRLLDPDAAGIELANPLAADLSVMRTTLWAGLLPALRHNLNRQQGRVRLFETGVAYRWADAAVDEDFKVAGVVYGAVHPEQWDRKARPVDFFDVKGDVEALLTLGGDGAGYSFEPVEHPALHPGQSAAIHYQGRPVGLLGALHPELESAFDLAGHAYLFELSLSAVRQARVPKFEPVPQFPSVRRDIAIVVKQDVSAAQISHCIADTAGEILRNLQLFDVYSGKGVDSGEKSLALGLTFQASSRTLRDTDVDDVVASVLKRLGDVFAARLRD